MDVRRFDECIFGLSMSIVVVYISRELECHVGMIKHGDILLRTA